MDLKHVCWIKFKCDDMYTRCYLTVLRWIIINKSIGKEI